MNSLHDLVQIDNVSACQLLQPGRELSRRLERQERGLALQTPDRLRQLENLRRPHDLGLLAAAPPLRRRRLVKRLGFGDQFRPAGRLRARRLRCCKQTWSSYSCGGDGASICSICLPRASASMVARELYAGFQPNSASRRVRSMTEPKAIRSARRLGMATPATTFIASRANQRPYGGRTGSGLPPMIAIAWLSRTTPSPATLKTPGCRPMTARTMASDASSSCRSWSRGSNPVNVGTSGRERYFARLVSSLTR